MRHLLFPLFAFFIFSVSCGKTGDQSPIPDSLLSDKDALFENLEKICKEAPGTVGIAFVYNQDTICINNNVKFPMMSVFNLHQALAVVNELSHNNISLDSCLHISKSDIDYNTWSPMLEKFTTDNFEISIRELIKFSLEQSDNNTSNILFNRVISPSETNRYIKSISSDTTFNISYSEARMKQNYSLTYQNYTSPLSAALLIKYLFDSSTPRSPNVDFIKHSLTNAQTGKDRISAPFTSLDDIFIAHKTGSGYRTSEGVLAAHNDVAYIRLPDGKEYALAVFIRDFIGSDAEASKVIANISATIYSFVISR